MDESTGEKKRREEVGQRGVGRKEGGRERPRGGEDEERGLEQGGAEGSPCLSLREYMASHWGPGGPQAPRLRDSIQLGSEALDVTV